MSTNEAADRLRLLFETGLMIKDRRNGYLAALDDALAHERSAGAAPLDALREAFSDFDPCHECDNAEKAWAAFARLTKGTDR